MIMEHITVQDVKKMFGKVAQSGEAVGRLERAVEIVNSAVAPDYVLYRYTITRENNEICVDGTDLRLTGRGIFQHLTNCDEIALLGATVGSGIDRQVETLNLTDIALAYLVDVCGAVAVEKLCDEVEAQLRAEVNDSGMGVTTRFSCGYDDFPLSTQRSIINVLKLDKRLGIRLTEGDMMLPTKSVTAVLGIGRGVTVWSERCSSCNKRDNCEGGLCSDT